MASAGPSFWIKPPGNIPRRVGLLGGSFNPAHEGHRHISKLALKTLGLDEVWWLVSPQNPLKPVEEMAAYNERFASALKQATHPRIKVSDLETRFGTRHTALTLGKLERRFPKTQFVWIMGADNLAQVSRWHRWEQIFEQYPVAVFARPTYALKALASKAAQRFASHRIVTGGGKKLAQTKPPVWIFVSCRLNPASSTVIRSQNTIC